MSHDYDAHLASATWRLFRQQVLARDEWRCVLCDTEEALEVHHRTYARLGAEKLRDCYTLCHACHLMVTDHQRRMRYTKRELPPLSNVAATTPNSDSYHWTTRDKDKINATDCQIPSQRCLPSFDAQWAARRPTQLLDKRNQEN